MKKNKNCNINLLYASRNYQHTDEEHKTIETDHHTTM